MADRAGTPRSPATPHAAPLAWDSAHFGFPVARLSAAATPAELVDALAELRSVAYRLAYWSVPTGDVERVAAARRAGGHLADEKLTYVRPLGGGEPPSSHARYAVERFVGDRPDAALMRLAILSGEYSRFRRDPSFPGELADMLYTRWIERSVGGEIADEVLVARDLGIIVGMITLGRAGERGDIGLVAVDPAAQGKGLGRLLVTEAGRRFAAAGRTAAQVVTQGENRAACRLYESCGYSIERSETVFHFWL
jgi:dTDP-4-amino-4,6-dideoxy-D-galactose acyltransferase